MADRYTTNWQRCEGALLFAVSLVLFFLFPNSLIWWISVLIFFAPDLSFIAFLLGPRIGAFCYNLVHNYGFGAVLLVAGPLVDSTNVTAVGILMLGHTGFDRMLGDGLKLPTGFTDTHLGEIGNQR